MIANKMDKLGIDSDKYSGIEESSMKYSFVLINPAMDFFLQPGDIIYLLKPGNSNNKNESAFELDAYNSKDATNKVKFQDSKMPSFNYTKHNSLDFMPNKFSFSNLKNNLMPATLSASLKSYLNQKQMENLENSASELNKKKSNVHVTINDKSNVKKSKSNDVTFI